MIAFLTPVFSLAFSFKFQGEPPNFSSALFLLTLSENKKIVLFYLVCIPIETDSVIFQKKTKM